jgi:hypothetical protein
MVFLDKYPSPLAGEYNICVILVVSFWRAIGEISPSGCGVAAKRTTFLGPIIINA